MIQPTSTPDRTVRTLFDETDSGCPDCRRKLYILTADNSNRTNDLLLCAKCDYQRQLDTSTERPVQH